MRFKPPVAVAAFLLGNRVLVPDGSGGWTRSTLRQPSQRAATRSTSCRGGRKAGWNVRENTREQYSTGINSTLDTQFETGGAGHGRRITASSSASSPRL